MKILNTTYQLLSDYSAGTEIITYPKAKEIARRDHGVCIFTGHRVKATVGASDLDVLVVPSSWCARSPLALL